jgi:putative addiction module component (TIGR02574 family)
MGGGQTAYTGVMNATLLDQARALSVDDQLELVGALWDDIAARHAVRPPSAVQQAELDHRIAEPGAAADWTTVKAEALARIGQ